MENKARGKNGSVELLRFVFCMIVLLCHITKDVYGRDSHGAGLFWRGQVSVELFFIISGYFMCRSAHRFLTNNQGENNISFGGIIKETKDFLVRKIGPLLFYHIVFNAFFLIYVSITRNYSFEIILSKIPSFFFLPALGVSGYSWNMGSEWYIGYMLFVMAVVYPFFVKWFKMASKYVAPVLGLCLYGYLTIRYHSIVNTDRMVRAFAGILLGASSFHGVHLIHKIIPKKRITVFSFLTFAVFLILIFYMYSDLLSRAVEPALVIVIWFALMFTFAERGLLSSTQILNNSFVLWLGRISLPIYMVQNITRCMVRDFGGGIRLYNRLLLTAVITVICGIFMYYACTLKNKMMGSGNKKLTSKVLVSLATVVLISTSVAWGLGLKNSYEQPDPELAEANMFRIVYHESDYGKETDQTTLVVCGTTTRTLKIKELGFNQDGRKFLGWKAYRPDLRLWRISNADGEKKWRKWIGDDELLALYKNGGKVKNTVKAGYTVHFYAQWAPR